MIFDPGVAPNLANIQALYDNSRFLDAYKTAGSYFAPSTNLSSLSIDQLILGGRLAYRLGGGRLCRWLFYTAYSRAPCDPKVRYFTHSLRIRERGFWDELRNLEGDPLLGVADTELESSWLAYQAVTWATLRDFARAESCLKRARSCFPRSDWVQSCHSSVLGMADQWEDALKAAEYSCELSPTSLASDQPYKGGVCVDSRLTFLRLKGVSRRRRSDGNAGEFAWIRVSHF